MRLEKESHQNKFLTHLTKDCNGNNAIHNLINIINSKVIIASKCHGFHRDIIWKSGLKSHDLVSFRQFDTVSFTSRLITLNKFIQYKRQNQNKFSHIFSQFGIVFFSQKIKRNGGKKVCTITDKQKPKPRAATEVAIKKIKSYKYKKCALKASQKIAKKLFNIDIIGQNYNHTYEQEYRHLGDFHFNLNQIRAILVKNKSEFIATLKTKNQTLHKEITSLEREKKIIITHPKFIGKIINTNKTLKR